MPETIPPRPVAPLHLSALVRQALLVSDQIPATVAAAAPPGASAPLQRTVLANDLVANCAANAVGTVQLLAERPDSDTIGEIYAMQLAFMRQLWTIERDWRDGWLQICQASLSLRKANTLSKIVEQDYNLVGQVGDLMVNTVASTASLIESATVGYSYWLTNKINEVQERP
ncbi:hypothetical protein DK419_12675 [Methylobacterium terrae]|uniref:Phasin domain-containing protein n=1 Tax=Methylobacterium terrae TaxID=2202827 RepID=A0A2U8WNF5_9HYPH|nr:hypothetical protein [Methylobacterium terrae]AWN47061.1 hypothetical protein DK419_12675 [Methylobacterium terrae]